jgi:hypothetical protein
VNDRPDDTRRRFWRLMGLMLALAAIGVAGVLGYLWQTGMKLHFHAALAIGLGVAASVLLAGALMGLVFASNRSGHDAAVRDDFRD